MTKKADGYEAQVETGTKSVSGETAKDMGVDFPPETGAGAGAYIPETGDEGLIATDFNVEQEYKPMPLIPNGWFSANITKTKIDSEQQCIVITHTLNENGGMLSDGQTPIDGTTLDQRIWLPKPGDENEMTKDGRQTKRQSKINMMKEAGQKLKIDLLKPIAIITAVRNADWIGMATKVKIGASEFEGRVRNEIKDAKAAS